MKRLISLTLFLSTIQFFNPTAAQTQLVVRADRHTTTVQPTMWGVFFEDINFGADGGIYAELIKNRSFEFAQPLMGWTLQESNRYSLNKESGSVLVINRATENASNPHVARVSVNSDKDFVMTNEGFRGLGIKDGNAYHFSIWARQEDGTGSTISMAVVTTQGQSLGSCTINVSGGDWKRYTASFIARGTGAKAVASLSFRGKGVTDIDMVSLFPQDTWKQRPGGMRADLVQLLADMKPGFVRFPGGCIVEGYGLDMRYQWKKTVGDVDKRELIKNRWNDEFKHRPAPDYYQTFGLGFFEYFQLAEDIGASPLPILNCGMACQFNSGEVVPLNELDPYVQDALDLIEFANGPEQSPWGRVRAQMGHPAPFNMQYLGIGNEQWGPQYIERYEIFAAAIHARYPDVKLVSSAGPAADGELFNYASGALKDLKADIVDEHYYQKPDWFLKNAGRYDSYSRNGPKIFAGEYAAQSVATVSPENKNSWLCALSEAAFMTGLERNADVVYMASYAPLFAHVEGWQWTPDLIWFDNLRSYGTPNYYVQKLFATNKGTHVVPLTANSRPVEGEQGLYASAVRDDSTREMILKLVNTNTNAAKVEIDLQGSLRYATTGRQWAMVASAEATNSLESPSAVAPRESTLALKGKKLSLELKPESFTVIRIAIK
ncbi:MAG TPA: alpha-L-arabinofuranosidase C-terminal domain-containing protein [Chryseolinea sp.]|nr:alpha-L-arabinofuranosidase C-terminal domain-containing protein [Chryseolinea sp.]